MKDYIQLIVKHFLTNGATFLVYLELLKPSELDGFVTAVLSGITIVLTRLLIYAASKVPFLKFLETAKAAAKESGTTNLLMAIGMAGMAFGLVLSQASCTPTAYQVNTVPYAKQIAANPESVVVQPEHVTEVGGFQAEFGAKLLTDQGEIDISDGGVSGDVVIDLRSGK